MDKSLIQEICLTPLDKIQTSGGSVLHALKSSETNFVGFGEAYFSVVNYGMIRGWKKHNEMTSNIIVPVGSIKFVLFDETKTSKKEAFFEVTLSLDNYYRLTIPPGIWLAFQGLSKKENILLNLSNLEHQPSESVQKDISEFDYDWSIIE
mgnify:CR=1 FL=1|tara:strand:+ start:876 stop:1325 length:450 start_codon:yes stop_codon:yes gene_type:complete